MRLLLAVLFLVLVADSASAQNNDMRAVMSRLDQIQRQMDTISKQVYRGDPPADAISRPPMPSDNSGLAAAVDERIGSIEGSMRQINNRLDEQDYAVGKLKQDFDLFKADFEVRMKELTAGNTAQAQAAPTPMAAPADADTIKQPVAAETASTETPAATTDKTPGASGPVPAGAVQDLPTENAAALYDAAFQALREQKYDRAEAGFASFMQKYPKDDLAGNAQYWLGETYYVRGNYAQAAKTFAQGYQKYPKSSKAPDNLLKLGLSLSQTGKKQDACVTLSQLGKQFPSAAAVIKQRANDEMKKLNCGVPATAAQ